MGFSEGAYEYNLVKLSPFGAHIFAGLSPAAASALGAGARYRTTPFRIIRLAKLSASLVATTQ